MAIVLGNASLARLNGVHPLLVQVVHRAADLSDQDFTVFEGLRSLETQKKYLARGVTKTMHSKHLKQADGLGHAVDLVPWIANGPRWEWPPIFEIACAFDQACQELGVAQHFTWGGVWSHRMSEYGGSPVAMKKAVDAYVDARRKAGESAFLDGPHFQYEG